jgi:type IV pilus assembly protein PilQ
LFNQAATRFLNLEITALQSGGRGKVISNPRVITADNVEADDRAGDRDPHQQASSSGDRVLCFARPP